LHTLTYIPIWIIVVCRNHQIFAAHSPNLASRNLQNRPKGPNLSDWDYFLEISSSPAKVQLVHTVGLWRQKKSQSFSTGTGEQCATKFGKLKRFSGHWVIAEEWEMNLKNKTSKKVKFIFFSEYYIVKCFKN